MQPKNFAERRKRAFSFAGLYVASVILLLFIFSAFGMNFSKPDARVAQAITSHSFVDNGFIQADSLLHEKLRVLQQADDSYTVLLADSTSVSQKTNASQLSVAAESAFKRALDSIDRMSDGYTGDRGQLYTTLVSSFKSILSSRDAVKNIQASMSSGKKVMSGSQLDMLQLKNELSMKEDELSRMRSEVKSLQANSFMPAKTSGKEEAQTGENELLKTAFADQQKEYADLKDKYSRLKTDNGNLASQIVEYKRAATAQSDNINTTANAKISSLEQKVQDLNADMYFTRIDCNLARADAQQMISNARQRKELLTESLTMLNTLASSGDAGIQKKAKEKIIRLNHIANTLHD